MKKSGVYVVLGVRVGVAVDDDIVLLNGRPIIAAGDKESAIRIAERIIDALDRKYEAEQDFTYDLRRFKDLESRQKNATRRKKR